MKKFLCLLVALAVLSLGGQTVSAEVKTFHAESSYFRNKGEPIKIAQEKAFKDAVRMISEEANIIVESLSEAKNSQLNTDRIETFTAAVLRIKNKTFIKSRTRISRFRQGCGHNLLRHGNYCGT